MSRVPDRRLAGVAAAVAAATWAGAASAHHSAAMYDHDKTVTVEGVVKEWKFQNPHSLLLVVAPGPAGAQTQWDFEATGAAAFIRDGVRRTSFLPGDKVSVRMHPLHDGRSGGLFVDAAKADGSVVGRRAR